MRAAGRSRREILAELGIGDDLAKELLRSRQLYQVVEGPATGLAQQPPGLGRWHDDARELVVSE